MMKKIHFVQAVLLICAMAIIHQAQGQTGDPAFVRWVDTGEQMGHLDTSIQSYRHPAGSEVHLVAAIHAYCLYHAISSILGAAPFSLQIFLVFGVHQTRLSLFFVGFAFFFLHNFNSPTIFLAAVGISLTLRLGN